VRRADHSSRGVLPSVVCLSVIVKRRRNEEAQSHIRLSSHRKKKVALVTSGNYASSGLTQTNSVFYPHTVCMFHTFSQQTESMSLTAIKRLVSVTVHMCLSVRLTVYCEVRTVYIYIII
jgi:hypothetical protein